MGFGRLPGNLDRLRAWDCVPEHVLGALGSLRSIFLVFRPEHVFSAPEQKIFLRATRENMFRKGVIIFGALKKFASHTAKAGPTMLAIFFARRAKKIFHFWANMAL